MQVQKRKITLQKKFSTLLITYVDNYVKFAKLSIVTKVLTLITFYPFKIPLV